MKENKNAEISEIVNPIVEKKQKITNNIINELIGIKESFELPEKLMSILKEKNKKTNLLNQFLNYDVDLSNDILRDYFQEEHSDRKGLKQDYTPDCLCKLISMLQIKSNNLLDICSGTGALTIHSCKENMTFQCEEYSNMSIPILLLNLSLRNFSGIVLEKNVLTNETIKLYKLVKKEKFSDIEFIDNLKENKFDAIISNPPYSMEWNPKYDDRFKGYELAPKNKADYSFILDGLYRLNKNGQALFILPHGILFRGGSEGKIRKQLIENNFIDAVIGLPSNLFLNTSIQTLILVLKKDRDNNNILFINSSEQYKKIGKQNVMLEEHINKIVDTFKERKQIDKFSSVVEKNKIIKNDYNLNIPRYVDTSEDEPTIDLKEVVKGIIEIDDEIKKTNVELKKLIVQLRGTNPQDKKYYEESIKPFIEWLG
ncbi:MAG: N-6 DNA methylase [Malacoplasma sp.]